MMQYIDVFNGDADGLCALVQLRRANPQQSQLVTGIKRNINLLSHVDAEHGDHVTVLDISLEKNAKDIRRLLRKGVQITYFDHHKMGAAIKHDNLHLNINLSADTCTSLIVDKQLQGQYRAWALTAAFGDNLSVVAQSLGQASGFSLAQLVSLRDLGVYLNYNGYGDNVEDLFFHPVDLYEKLQPFDTPFEFLVQNKETFDVLANGYRQDMSLAEHASVIHKTKDTTIIQLPDERWARRVSGVFGNELANKYPEKGHAVITEKQDDSYLVSVRAPLNRKFGADDLVSQFPTGGGRKSAAGINRLPADMLGQFIDAFDKQFSI